MKLQTPPGNRMSWKLLIGLAVVALLFSACNLQPQTPSEPTTSAPLDTTLIPEGTGGQAGQATSTPFIVQAATDTPMPQLLPSETIQQITVDGDTHRTLEAITIHVQRGVSVSSVTCSWVLQGTGESGTLTNAVTTQIDENFFEDVYTLTPELAGTYSINCSGVALTQLGQRPVSAVGTPFSVEAKG